MREGEPSRTAWGAAVHRAVHPVLDHPVLFEDPLAFPILGVDSLDPDYRGPEFVALARSLGAELVPSVIGDAARTGDHDPQSLKRVWHLLARFGRAPQEAPSPAARPRR